MIVGGNDISFEVTPGTPIAALVLESARRYWPESQFQDAEKDDVHPIQDDWVLNHGSRSQEFFIYRDLAAVESWKRWGATPANLNKMLYVIIGTCPRETRMPWELTLVCGRQTKRLQRFITELKKTIRSFRFPRQLARQQVA